MYNDKNLEKKSHEEIKGIVFHALSNNINYAEQNVLGIPASYLDDKIFNQNVTFLADAPFISTLVQNPNHIGCHTLGSSESFFRGTQKIEKELIEICAVDILQGQPEDTDGYVASGGTEANIQAIWIYRNYFLHEYSAISQEICILCSEDSHYSTDKAGNLLGLEIYKIPTDANTKEISTFEVEGAISRAKENGKKYFIVICNMMTTMFGSVDDIHAYTDKLAECNCTYKLHVDGAYGGFYYPFANDNSQITFKNQHISSFTLDAHKMAQAPYGTGIFLIRKGLIHHVNTKEASYVEGEDLTLIGSRSGANAIAVWMILSTNGPFGWFEKIFILQKRAEWMAEELIKLGVQFYRHPNSNIIAIRCNFISTEIASKFGLVPDNHDQPKWFKIVIMEHVTIEKMRLLLADIKIN